MPADTTLINAYNDIVTALITLAATLTFMLIAAKLLASRASRLSPRVISDPARRLAALAQTAFSLSVNAVFALVAILLAGNALILYVWSL
jgi:hypothetical protein